MNRRLFASACGLVLALASTDTAAQFAIFNEATDAIQVSGDTVLDSAATFEVVVRFPEENGAFGQVFGEWTDFAEDKQLYLGPEDFQCFLYPLPSAVGPVFSGSLALTRDEWHHVAYVYDGSQQSLYVDGALVSSTPLSGDVGGGSGVGYVGAPRAGGCTNGFVGDLESLRISNVARYLGSSFTPTIGDFTSDDNTLLLYNFNDPPGSSTITDSGPLARTGTTGLGCAEATSPQIGVCADSAVPRGSITASDALTVLLMAVGSRACDLCVCDTDGSGAVTASDALKTLKLAVGQQVSLSCPLCETARPVAVLEPANAVTAVIGRAGGTLSATATGGTIYELTIPADALPGATEITMTPATGIDGLPLSGGLVGAVELQPSGLQLARSALLRIGKSAAPPAGQSLAGFTFASGDTAVRQSIAVGGSDAVIVLVPHFSVHGAGYGSAEDLGSLLPNWGLTSAERRLWDELTDVLYPSSESSPEEQLDAYLHWFDEIVLPVLQRAGTDVELLGAAQAYENWVSGYYKVLVDMLGFPDDIWDPWYVYSDGSFTEEIAQRLQAWGDLAGPKFRAAFDANNELCDSSRSLAALRNTLLFAHLAYWWLNDLQLEANGLDITAVQDRLCAQLVVDSVSLSDPLSAEVPSDLAVSFSLRFRSAPNDIHEVPVQIEFSGVNAHFSNPSPVFSDAQGGFIVGVAAEAAGMPVTVFLGASLALDGEVDGFVHVDEVVHRNSEGGTGVHTVLPPEGSSNIYAYDINGSGHVVGDIDSRVAYIWRGGAPTPLPKMSDDDFMSRARGINNQGDIVGLIYGAQGNSAVLWPGGGAPVDLGTSVAGLGWELQEAQLINDKGQIAGVGKKDGTWAYFFLDVDNSITKIMDQNPGNAIVSELSEEGAVAGYMNAGSNPMGFIWRRGADRIDIVGQVMSVANVGAYLIATGAVRQSLSSTRGVTWHSPYGEYDFTEIEPPDPSYMTWPQHIGDDGSVVGFFSGQAIDGNYFSKAFYWKGGSFTDLSSAHGAGTNSQQGWRIGEGGQVLLVSMRVGPDGYNQSFFMVVPAP